jgi:predicted nucleic acid-binding protein
VPDRVLVDAGPLVALLSVRDAAHQQCNHAISSLAMPLVSSWAVLAEAAWLLRNSHGGLTALMRLVAENVVECPELGGQAAHWISACADRYSDLRPQLADLTLLYLAEQEQLDTVFTLDRRDFLVFKTADNRAFKLIPESAPSR